MNTSKIKIMQIMLTGFCAAIVSFAMVAILLNKEAIYFDIALIRDQPVFPLTGLSLVFFGLFMFKTQLDKLPEGTDTDTKIAAYQTAFIIRSAFLEGASLMNIVGFLLSANALFLIVPAIAIALMIFTRPTKQSVSDALNLSYPDTEKL
jgi:hypothetical protein